MAINQEKWLTHFFSAAATPFFLDIFFGQFAPKQLIYL
jgi:hypothetical protein